MKTLEERRVKLVFWKKIEQTLEQILREIKPSESKNKEPLEVEVKNENNNHNN